MKPGLFNTKARYGTVAQILHWATAILILMLLPMGFIMYQLPDSTSAEIADKVWVYSLHKTLGLTVLTIAVLRVLWALFSPHPRPLHPERKLETFAATSIHWILYGSIILMPVLGYVHHASSTGFAPVWGPFPNELSYIPKSEAVSKYAGFLHFLLGWTMVGSVGLHIAGALKHAVIDKDSTLARMTPFKGTDLPDQMKDTPAAIGRSAPLVALLVFIGLFSLPAILQTIAGQQEIETAANTSTEAEATPVPDAASSATENTQAASETATAPQWIVDPSASKLSVTILQLGAPVTGEFSTWDAQIFFDPDDLEASSVDVTIDTNSLTLGSVTAQAKSADFLDVQNHSEGKFVASEFAKTDSGYVANGELTLHGNTVPVSLPFELTIVGSDANMTGSVSLNRMDFEVGAKGFADESSVAFEVTVGVEVIAQRAN